MKLKAGIMDECAVKRALARVSHEIIEHNRGTKDVCIVGIVSRGKPIAEMITYNIERIEGVKVQCGDIDINYYRDDLSKQSDAPVLKKCELPFSIEGKHVVLADDVIYTGRTARAAIEAIFSIGRPASIQLAVLVDRGHRELPIRADYVGKNIPTSRNEIVKVSFPPYEDTIDVALYERDNESLA